MPDLESRRVGASGLLVSPVGLGCNNFGRAGTVTEDLDGTRAVLDAAIEAGVTFLDTADMYGKEPGLSETLMGEALRGRRDEVVIATKFGHAAIPSPWIGGSKGSRAHVRHAVEASLRRLQTDWIDLYQVHRPEAGTDVEETLSALTDLQRQGKIRAFGSSTFPAHEVVEAQWTAERRALGRFVTEQPPYSMLVRGIEKDLLPVTEKYGMGVLPWSPLAGGWLSGRYRKDLEIPTSHRRQRMAGRYDLSIPANQAKLDAADALAGVAAKAGLTLVHMALAFTLAHPAVTAPIIGPRTLEHLDSQLGAVDVTLDADVLDAIDEIVPPGVTLSQFDEGYVPPSLQEPFLRRRRTA